MPADGQGIGRRSCGSARCAAGVRYALRVATKAAGGEDVTQVVDPDSGLTFVELSHPWGMYTPIFPGYEEIKLERITYHAKHGVMTHKITTIFDTSTHVNAPIHLVPQAPAV